MRPQAERGVGVVQVTMLPLQSFLVSPGESKVQRNLLQTVTQSLLTLGQQGQQQSLHQEPLCDVFGKSKQNT